MNFSFFIDASLLSSDISFNDIASKYALRLQPFFGTICESVSFVLSEKDNSFIVLHIYHFTFDFNAVDFLYFILHRFNKAEYIP